jgi:hypothetical protein
MFLDYLHANALSIEEHESYKSNVQEPILCNFNCVFFHVD